MNLERMHCICIVQIIWRYRTRMKRKKKKERRINFFISLNRNCIKNYFFFKFSSIVHRYKFTKRKKLKVNVYTHVVLPSQLVNSWEIRTIFSFFKKTRELVPDGSNVSSLVKRGVLARRWNYRVQTYTKDLMYHVYVYTSFARSQTHLPFLICVVIRSRLLRKTFTRWYRDRWKLLTFPRAKKKT